MIARSLLWVGLIAMSSGCIVPRVAGYGMTAAPIGAGGADVGMALGVAYQQETSAPSGTTVVTSSTTRQTQFPAFEANAQLGLSDQISLNVHASQAGLQPGVKVTLVREPVMVAVIPQLGGGFVSSGGSSQTTVGGSTTTTEQQGTTSFTFLGGVHVIASLPVGLYAGLGYDFQYTSRASPNLGGNGSTTLTQQAHNTGLAIGYELRLGNIALRPEVAVLFTPLAKNQSINGSNPQDQADTSGLFLYPNITVSGVAPGRGK